MLCQWVGNKQGEAGESNEEDHVESQVQCVHPESIPSPFVVEETGHQRVSEQARPFTLHLRGNT